MLSKLWKWLKSAYRHIEYNRIMNQHRERELARRQRLGLE